MPVLLLLALCITPRGISDLEIGDRLEYLKPATCNIVREDCTPFYVVNDVFGDVATSACRENTLDCGFIFWENQILENWTVDE